MSTKKKQKQKQTRKTAAQPVATEGAATVHDDSERLERERKVVISTQVEPLESKRKAGRDLAWIVIGAIIVIVVSIAFSLIDRLLDLESALSTRNFNGLIALLLITPIGASVFAYRRYKEGMQAQRTLTNLSVTDVMTGLPNRRFLGEKFNEFLQAHQADGGRVAVMFIDLDGFKAINDTYGHEVGDKLMAAVGDRLRRSVKAEDVAVRYAGDEFVVIITDVPSAQIAERIAGRLIKVIETPFELGNDRIQISASIGVTVAEQNCTDPGDVIRDADAAMYQAKGHGPGTFALFDRSMRDRLTPSTAERRLRYAVEHNEFSVWYQPVVSLWTRRLVGVEALLRWDHPERGSIRPDDFLPALEDTGLIVPVGRWVVATACTQAQWWAQAFPGRPPINLTVNLSPRQIKQADFIDSLRDTLRSTGISPETLFLEIDERALAANRGVVWQTLRTAKKLGVRIALDDFGAGLSSLKQLHEFELDLLKIDGTYVRGLGLDRSLAAIVEHVIGLSKALNVVTLAENVETSDQFEQLRSLGCDLAQGYFFSTPQPAHVITELLTQPTVNSEWRPGQAPLAGVAPAIAPPAPVRDGGYGMAPAATAPQTGFAPPGVAQPGLVPQGFAPAQVAASPGQHQSMTASPQFPGPGGGYAPPGYGGQGAPLPTMAPPAQAAPGQPDLAPRHPGTLQPGVAGYAQHHPHATTASSTPGYARPGPAQPSPAQPGQHLPGPAHHGPAHPGQHLPGQHLPGQHLPGQHLPGPQQPGPHLPGPQQPGLPQQFPNAHPPAYASPPHVHPSQVVAPPVPHPNQEQAPHTAASAPYPQPLLQLRQAPAPPTEPRDTPPAHQ